MTGSGMLQDSWRNVATRIERIGADPADSDELQLKKRLLVAIALMVTPAALVWGSILLLAEEPIAALVPLLYAGFSSGTILLFALTQRLRFFRFSQLLLILALPFALQMALGGFVQGSGVVLWAWLSPLGALLVAERKQALWWFIAFLGVLAISGVFEGNVERSNNLPVWLRTAFFVMNLGTVAGITFLALRYFNRQKDWAMELLAREQHKSEQLLLNVLPPSIATLLKDGDRTIATYHEQASILFADIADFTELSVALPPGEVVEMLNALFTKFDQLTEERGLEKIKTIGDSYMVAAGVPEPRTDHAEVLADLALELMAAVGAQTFNGHRLLLRIGINSGPVVAGVIGTHKFSYDLWGDTVNTASRIEQYGLSGEIRVSATTRERIEHRFDLDTCEPVEMKGKGFVQVSRLKGRKHSLPLEKKDRAGI